MIVNKLWGCEEWLVNDDYCVKRMTLKPDCQCSLHYHEKKDESFYILEGRLDLTVNGVTHRLNPGDFYRIKPYDIHRFKTIDDVCVFLESSTHHDDEDVVRLEPSKEL